MIVYDLKCANGHRFEGWFDDSRAFDEQQTRQLVVCPICSDPNVSRMPSTFAIKSPKARNGSIPDPVAAAKQFCDFVATNFEDVGSEFAKEALKIHYGVTEPRNIRGVSTDVEEKTLREEGVSFFKFPAPSASDKES